MLVGRAAIYSRFKRPKQDTFIFSYLVPAVVAETTIPRVRQPVMVVRVLQVLRRQRRQGSLALVGVGPAPLAPTVPAHRARNFRVTHRVCVWIKHGARW